MSGLRVGDTFGFDYNEMALSTFHQISLENRLQSVRHNEKVECLLCPSSHSARFCSLMKHKQKMFSVREEVQGCNARNTYKDVCVRVFFFHTVFRLI